MKIFIIVISSAFAIVIIWAIGIMIYNYRLKKGMKKIHEMMERELVKGELSPEDAKKFKALSKMAKQMYEEIKITKPIEWEDE